MIVVRTTLNLTNPPQEAKMTKGVNVDLDRRKADRSSTKYVGGSGHWSWRGKAKPKAKK
jgi:hypothetical protein